MSKDKAFENGILHYLEQKNNNETIVEIVRREGYLNNVHYDIQTGEKRIDDEDSKNRPLRVKFL